MTFNERNVGNGDFRFEYKKTKIDFYRLRSLAGLKWFSLVRQDKKHNELTSDLSEFVRLRAESGLRTNLTKRQKKKNKLTDNPKKEKTRFGLS